VTGGELREDAKNDSMQPNTIHYTSSRFTIKSVRLDSKIEGADRASQHVIRGANYGQ